jgi:hypothetical protein
MQINKGVTTHRRIRDKTLKIISMDEEKPLDKINHLCMIKSQQKLGIEGTYFNIIKSTYHKPIANIILSGENLKSFPVK